MDGANDSDHSMTWEDFFAVQGNVGIYGGKEVYIESAPYMAGLIHLLPDYFAGFCGGSIIHERFILTAAHCFSNETDLSTIKVSVGTDHWYHRPFVRMVVEKRICHENYTAAYPYHNDICLWKLRQSVPLGPNVGLVKLPDEDFRLKEGALATLSGWGEIAGESLIRDALSQVTIPIMENKRCHRLYRNLSDKVFCAGRPLFGDCEGDSGGPLVYNSVQIGVMSFGAVDKNGRRRCGEIAGVYTNVSSYLKWINTTISENL